MYPLLPMISYQNALSQRLIFYLSKAESPATFDLDPVLQSLPQNHPPLDISRTGWIFLLQSANLPGKPAMSRAPFLRVISSLRGSRASPHPTFFRRVVLPVVVVKQKSPNLDDISCSTAVLTSLDTNLSFVCELNFDQVPN